MVRLERPTKMGMLAVTLALGMAACSHEIGESPDDATAQPSGAATVTQPIINGDVADSNPGAVALYLGVNLCSGTLVDADAGWILTAAHCVTTDKSINGPLRDPATIFATSQLNPGTSAPPGANRAVEIAVHGTIDVAMVRAPGRYKEIDPAPLGLWVAPNSQINGQWLLAYGYGDARHVDGQDTLHGTLRTSWFSVGTTADPTVARLTPWQSTQTTCHGDSGGPGFVDVYNVKSLASIHRGSWCDPQRPPVDVLARAAFPYMAHKTDGLWIRQLSALPAYGFLQADPAGSQIVRMVNHTTRPEQRWQYDAFGNRRLLNRNGQCLELRSNDSTNGTRVWTAPCNGSAAQQWDFTSNGEIKNANGKCLDAPNGDTRINAPLQIWDCNGTAAQKFSFVTNDLRIKLLHLTFGTGGDGLSSTSAVWALVKTGNKATEWIRIPTGELPAFSEHTFAVPLPQTIGVNQIDSVSLFMEHGTCAGCQNDRWNLDYVKVSAPGRAIYTKGAQRQLLNQFSFERPFYNVARD